MKYICLLISMLILIFLLFTIIIIGFKFSNESFESLENESERNITERVLYYLGNLTKDYNINYSKVDFHSKSIHLIDENILHENNKKKLQRSTFDNYFSEIKNYYKKLKQLYPHIDARIIFIPGDVSHSRKDVPMVSKTRPINQRGLNVILPLNNVRHWKPVREAKEKDTIPWENKKPRAVWRGAATGRDKRIQLVENWRNFPDKSRIDIAFTSFLDSYKGEKNPILLGDRMTLDELLQNRYLISVEGNDVASNLKWILASQTVCIMPEPQMESWLMESLLVPWKHYVPVKSDFSDLMSVLYYCEQHPNKMKDIIKNANEYMEQFNDQDKETEIITRVLKGYCDKTNIQFK